MTETVESAVEARPTTGPRTIARLWCDAVDAGREGAAYLVESDDGWQPISWPEADERVRGYANGLLARGVRKGDTFALLARNSLDWALLDFALAQIGAVGIPVYASSSSRTSPTCSHTRRRWGIVCEDAEQLAKVEAVTDELPALQHVLTYHDLEGLAAHGRDFAPAHPRALDDATAAIAEDDLYTIIYTSGTTGPPRAACSRHRNYYEMRERRRPDAGVLPAGRPHAPVPPARPQLRAVDAAARREGGFHDRLPRRSAAGGEVLPTVRPTLLPSVPRVYEKIYSAVQARFAEATGAKKSLVEWALGVGREASALEARGEPVPFGLRSKRSVADRLVFSKVRGRSAGGCEWRARAARRFTRDRGVLRRRAGSGSSRATGSPRCTTACASTAPTRYRFGTVGKALPGVEVEHRRGRRDPGARREHLRGLLQGSRGDRGGVRRRRLVPHRRRRRARPTTASSTITDRKKDILVTAGGKNIAPQNIENELKTSPYVSQALVLGDRRPYVAALLTLDPLEIGRWAAEQGIDGDVESLARTHACTGSYRTSSTR